MRVAELSAIVSNFQKIKSRAEAQWRELWSGNKPVILVGAATCGRATGALEVLQTLRDEVKKRNLDCPVIEVGCMGHCYAEPIVIISKPGYSPICYGRVNPVISEKLTPAWNLCWVLWKRMTSFPVWLISPGPNMKKRLS